MILCSDFVFIRLFVDVFVVVKKRANAGTKMIIKKKTKIKQNREKKDKRKFN